MSASFACLVDSGVTGESEERLLDRWEEPALLIVDRVIQIDRESTQRSSCIARLCFSETIRAGISDCADERSKSVVAFANLSSDLRR
jgi:hypothetical protein